MTDNRGLAGAWRARDNEPPHSRRIPAAALLQGLPIGILLPAKLRQHSVEPARHLQTVRRPSEFGLHHLRNLVLRFAVADQPTHTGAQLVDVVAVGHHVGLLGHRAVAWNYGIEIPELHGSI